MKQGDYIQLKKLENLDIDNPDITIGYTIEGFLVEPIQVHRPIFVLRTKRNGVNVLGEFNTSDVTEIIPGSLDNTTTINTRNSSWILTPLEFSSEVKW